MATAVRDVQPPADTDQAVVPDSNWDWREAPRPGDTDPITARAAREQRVAWRLAHPDAWRAQLAALEYFDPAYAYDEGHEYGDDWTTDPHLGEDIRHKILDEDGFASPPHYRHTDMLILILYTLRKLFGNRVEREPELHFAAAYAERPDIHMFTEGGNPSTQVEPDLVVLPQALELPAGVQRSDEGRTLRLNAGDPPPELVLEILSPSTRNTDLEAKMALYAALDIAEYLILAPGGKPQPDTPAVLWLHRLHPDGRYAEIGRIRGDAPEQSVFSEVCGTHLRL